jgi:predicted nucleotidyltransferase
MPAQLFLADRALHTVRAILGRQLPVGIKAFAFGSRAHGRNMKPFSDLDICLRADQALPEELIAGIAEAFRESNLPFRVDIVDWHAVAPDFQDAIKEPEGYRISGANATNQSTNEARAKTSQTKELLNVEAGRRGFFSGPICSQ